MLGAVIGDVIGSFYEGNSTKNKDFPLITDFSKPTDDTILSTATAEALLHKGAETSVSDFAVFFRSWGNKYPGAGFGGNFRRWLRKADAPAYNSWGNGSSMRVSPIGWFADDEQTALKLAEQSALCTHNHPEGVKGACASALAVFLARTGNSKDQIRNRITELFGYDLHRKIEVIRENYTFQISCQKSVPEAITAFLDSGSFEEALRNAVSLGGDSDTQAAICCSIAEAFYADIPEKFTAMVLPRLPMDVLSVIHGFAQKYLPASSAEAIQNEVKIRTGRNIDGICKKYSRFDILMHSTTRAALQDYTDGINNGKTESGSRVLSQIENLPIPAQKWELMLHCLLNSKKSRIYAESELNGDGSDWSQEELKILGGISIAVPVTVFDDGKHAAPRIHRQPFDATLIYTPGILLRNDLGKTPVDRDVVDDGRLNLEKFIRRYEEKLLPALKYASSMSLKNKRKAIVTIPGIGCGQFAGNFRDKAPYYLKEALETILEDHHHGLNGISLVYYDPYSSCADDEKSFGNLRMRTRPFKNSSNPLPQLCSSVEYQENGDVFSGCDLYSIVAWDHVSWPGNDFFTGSRATDDGVKAAASDSMFRLTGIRGAYDQESNRYMPPEGYNNWEEAVIQNQLELRVTENVVVTAAGDKYEINE